MNMTVAGTMSAPVPEPAGALLSAPRAMIPAWSIHAWPTLVCRAQLTPEWRLCHFGTRVLTPGGDAQPSTGQTLWASDLEQGAAAVAWDWVELCPGVVALADPLGLVSNLHLVDDHGTPLPDLQAALHLNQLVRALPWQTEVQRALEGRALN